MKTLVVEKQLNPVIYTCKLSDDDIKFCKKHGLINNHEYFHNTISILGKDSLAKVKKIAIATKHQKLIVLIRKSIGGYKGKSEYIVNESKSIREVSV